MLRLTRDLAAGPVHVCFTDRSDGDFATGRSDTTLADRRRELTGADWVWLHQVHGATVVHAATGRDTAGVDADAVVTRDAGVQLAVHTADCVPVALMSEDGALAAVHAGWRGLEAGVIAHTVADLRTEPGEVSAIIGPCIHVECYEFGEQDRRPLVARYGAGVAGTTTAGHPALDMVAATRAALAIERVTRIELIDHCTACDPSWFSHRARRDRGRQAMVVWRPAPDRSDGAP